MLARVSKGLGSWQPRPKDQHGQTTGSRRVHHGAFGCLKEEGKLGGSKEGRGPTHTALSALVRILDFHPRAMGSH